MIASLGPPRPLPYFKQMSPILVATNYNVQTQIAGIEDTPLKHAIGLAVERRDNFPPVLGGEEE